MKRMLTIVATLIIVASLVFQTASASKRISLDGTQPEAIGDKVASPTSPEQEKPEPQKKPASQSRQPSAADEKKVEKESSADSKTVQANDNSVDAYLKALPEINAAAKQKHEREMERLKAFADRIKHSLEAAEKTAGFDTKSSMAEFETIAKTKDPAKQQELIENFNVTYQSKLKELARAAGISAPEQRQLLVSELGFQRASLKESPTDTFEIEIKDPKLDDSPLLAPDGIQTPTQDVIERVFTAPFTAAGRVGGRSTSANATSGVLLVDGFSTLASSFQDLAFISQTLAVEPGVRHIQVYAMFPGVYYRLNSFVLLGYASTEAIVNLRVMEGSRVIAADRVSLGRLVGAVVGGGFPGGTRPVTLHCEFTRDRPDAPATYNLIAEFEGWTGTGRLATTWLFQNGGLQQFQVFLSRRNSNSPN